jgi:hypothetical protein
MTTSIYLELPWQGRRQMFSDITGFFAVTVLLILIDSYILCENQDTLRILLSIGIDYAILLFYIAARNNVMTSGSNATPQTQPQALRDQVGQQDLKWKEAKGSFPDHDRQTATR